MNRIMSRIHSGDLTSVIVAWSPNIMMIHFIKTSFAALRPRGRSSIVVGAAEPFLDIPAGPENPNPVPHVTAAVLDDARTT
jgi:hypothetical protein